MPIIKFTKNATTPEYAALNIYPDQFASQKTKEGDDWIKVNMDYWYTAALNQFQYNKLKFVPNYELYAGKLRKSDFYNQPEVIQTFTETILQDEDLPAYVKHYSILTPMVNTLRGELNRRPDNTIVKALDEDSQSEELQYKTEVLNKYIADLVRTRIVAQAAMEGIEMEDSEEFEKMTSQKVKEQMESYTTRGEMWGNVVLDFMKMRFNIKEKSEEAFTDMLKVARQAYHIYEDDSSLGFNVEVLNPKNVWMLNTPDKKYISDPYDANNGAYAAGTIQVMELSEIISRYKLTKEEIDHLREASQQAYLIQTRESNLVNPRTTGAASVKYDVYDPLVLQYRQVLEGEMGANANEMDSLLGITSSVGVFGNKYVVVQAYWRSKKKVGLLKYVDVDGNEVTEYVDEHYKDGMHPQQISLEWGYINQWYKGLKIGLDIYYVEPLAMLDYCPIIGVLYEPKNLVAPASMIDQAKPYQMMYNIAMNKLFRLSEKDMGKVFLTSIRHVPIPRDGDYQDALEVWETEAREKGVIFVDDSPENLKAPSSFNQHREIDLSRSQEIQAYYTLAVQMRTECWKLAGLTEQRLGESRATETATSINSALTQSYAQTEPWFAQHQYTLNKLYQALLDAALYMESNKPTSTISYITSEGNHAFAQINGSELKLKELGVFATDRADDARNMQELRALAQQMLQNGATPYEIAELYSTKSTRKMKSIFKQLKETQEQFQQQQQMIEQQKLQQAQAQFEQQQQMLQLQDEKDKAFESYQREQDRISKEKIAWIQASGLNGEAPDNSTADYSQLENEQLRLSNDYQTKIKDITLKQQQLLMQQNNESNKMKLEKEKLAVEREKIASQERVAKLNKNKYDKKK